MYIVFELCLIFIKNKIFVLIWIFFVKIIFKNFVVIFMFNNIIMMLLFELFYYLLNDLMNSEK